MGTMTVKVFQGGKLRAETLVASGATIVVEDGVIGSGKPDGYHLTAQSWWQALKDPGVHKAVLKAGYRRYAQPPTLVVPPKAHGDIEQKAALLLWPGSGVVGLLPRKGVRISTVDPADPLLVYEWVKVSGPRALGHVVLEIMGD